MKTHKLTESATETFGFTECGRNLTFRGGQGSEDWDDVDCENCLKHFAKNTKEKTRE